MSRDTRASSVDTMEDTNHFVNNKLPSIDLLALPPHVDHVLLDLDDTLYQVAEFPQGMLNHITEYMVNHLDFAQDSVMDHASRLYANHGTTLAGLCVEGNHNIDFKHWHDNIHGPLPYHKLQRDERLLDILRSIPPHIKKYVFTNADDEHCRRCVKKLGLDEEGLLDGYITFETLNPHPTSSEAEKAVGHRNICCKPLNEAFLKAMEHAMKHSASTGNLLPERFLFVDDSRRNVLASAKLGLHTVFVGDANALSDHPEHEHPHAVVKSIHELPHVLSTPNLKLLG